MPGEEAGPAERKGSESTDAVQPEKSDTKVAGAQLPVSSRFNFKSVLWTFGRCLSALLPVYLAGYYRISTGLLVFGLTFYTGWKHARDAKEARLRSAMQSLEDGEGSQDGRALRGSQRFPGSIHIPDLEKVEWLNKVLQQAWPFVGQYLEKLLVESIAPSIRSSSTHLQTLSFTKIDMGCKPMKVVGVKVHTENDKGQILLDLYINYVGDVEIDVEVKRYFCKAGVKGIQLKGMMRVILEPLIGDVPIAAAVTMFFIQRPKLDINWTGLTNLLDVPGLNVMSDKMIMDAIASFLVLPNRLTVPLVAGLPVAQLRSPLPRGVVRIHLVEAQDLAAKDSYVKGVTAGISDPYAVLRVGPQSFTSHHVDNNLNPQWGEMYEVIVHEVPGQELEVEVYDKDPDQDDFLGRVTIDLGMVKQAHVLDEWFPLKDIDTGRLHLKMEWLSLLPSSDKLEQVIERNKTVAVKASSRPSAAILAVYLDRAEELPMKKGNKEPSPLVQLSVQGVARESRMCAETTNPVWEDAFTFFLHVPNQQNIVIQVKDSDRVQLLGSLSIPLSRLLANHDLSVDDWFPLADAKATSRISLRAVLRVLWLDEEAALHAPKVWVSGPASEGTERPQHTSPSDGFATEGVLRIQLVEARNLIAKDNLMGGMVKGKSDPYVKTRVGGKTFRSHVVNKNLNPTWNELYEVILTRVPGQEVQFDLYDDDVGTDEFLGRFKVGLSDIIRSQHVDQWYTLNDVKSGSVHLVLDWMPTVVDPARLDEALKLQAQKSYHNKTVPSAALLVVFVERAHALPLKKSGKEPMVGAELILGGVSYKTKVCDRSCSPKWNESFSFLVRDPPEDILTVKLSHNWGLALGSLFLRVKDLLSVPGLALDSWLSVDGASADSEILLRAELKLLCSGAVDGSGGQADAPSMPDTPSSKTKSDVIDPNKGTFPTAKEGLQQKAGDSGNKVSDSVSAGSLPPLSPTGPGHKEESPEDSVGKRPCQTTPNSSFATEGVLRIHLVEAQNLIAKDNHMGGMVKGKSDPYVKIHIGAVKFCSQVIKENLNPIWNELYEVVLNQQAEQEVQFEVYDKDVGTDDFLGRFNVSLSDIISSQYMDEWYTLSEVKSGHVHLVLEWVPKVQDRTRLDQVLQLRTQKLYQNKAVPTAALLFVYVERAHALPIKKSGKEPKVGAEIIFRETTHKTKVCDRSTSPQWDEAVHFLVPDPKEDILKVKLYHTGDQPTGSLVLPVRELLSEPGLVLDRWLSLDGVPAESQILLRAELKILDSKILKVAPVQAGAPASPEEVQRSLTPPKDTVSLSNQGLIHEAEAAKGPHPGSSPVSPKPEKIKEEKHLETAVGGADQTGTVSVPASTPSAKEVEKTVVPPKDTITPPSQEVIHKAALTKGDEGPHPARAPVSPTPEKVKEGAAAKVEPQEVSIVPSPVSTKPSRTSPDPSFATEGLLRIHLVEAQHLIAMDGFMAGGKSDPYVKICVGNIKFRSHVIKENLNPTWNELYEVVLTKAPGQEIQFELFDKDLDSDDFLGRLKVSLSDIISSRYSDKWYTLTDVKSGRIHLVLEWVSTVSDPVRLDQVLRFQAQQSYQNKAVPSAALLFVYVDRAHGLPLKKSGKEPKVGAELDLGATSYKTKVCDRSTAPHWGEGYHFLLHDPKKDTLILKLYHTGDQPTGSLVLPVRELLSEPGLVLDRWLSLDGVPAESQILLRAELKILEPMKVQAGDRGLPTVSASTPSDAPGHSGQVKLSLSYPKDDKKLLITVHACRHLTGSSDPYVSFILLPDKNKVTKRKTGIKKKDANPEFNERFDFNISMDEARQKQLDLTVKNSTSFMSREKEVIGKVQIDLSSVDLASGVTQWFDLKEES
ncbi:extended synaptotagmin-1 isoform X10 [Brienomyrus brachyistius]|uniref:extended synaptotagmin-1 isoform X7 n=1 Tax=Brienomyrus brachyistius TaxID=42636 RepID=UPI0020B1D699|nr:extended synaptotagmin-1 isoform X7 [Brienomyrus brachyistius]XP_048856221.1 extended synaptotagmin-1 isoform X8 [Brienomyrus brachyistius]XP_048856222.1 extended synaptotagmin-1 isoform X9 [Brienomyrus brachyistius]XP_048856223.1 extended synaptotagmin-1 isoform X10 [Brienomyrus brachyistius]